MTPYYHKAGELADIVENIQNFLTRQESAVAAATPPTPTTSLLTLNGDVEGLAGDNRVQALQGTTLTISSLTGGDILLYDGTSWTNSAAYVTTAPATSARNVVVAGDSILPLTLAVLDTGGGTDRAALRPSLLQLRHRTTLTSVPGVGGAIDWTVPDDAAADQTIASMIAEITQVSAGSTEATIGVVVKHQGQDCEVMRFRGQTGMAATSVGATGALKGYVGGEAWCRGNFRVTGDGGSNLVTTDAATNTPLTVLTVGHLSSGAAAAGLGAEIHLDSQGSAGTQVTFGHMRALYAGGGAGAENGTFIWGSIMGGTKVDLMRFRTTVGMAPSGGVGGQVWVQADLLHSGNSLSFFNGAQVAKQTGASAAGIAAIVDVNVKAAITALQTALANYSLVTSPA